MGQTASMIQYRYGESHRFMPYIAMCRLFRGMCMACYLQLFSTRSRS